MADELNKKNPIVGGGSSSESAPKPKTIGTPAPNVPKPKQTPTTKPQLTPKSSMPKKMTIKPGNPNLGESAPVGIQRKRFESDKHANKRLNKMFDETKAATLGVWNHDNTHPMAKPNSVKFNSNLEYKPSQEALEAANRKKIMQQGFAPRIDLKNLNAPIDKRNTELWDKDKAQMQEMSDNARKAYKDKWIKNNPRPENSLFPVSQEEWEGRAPDLLKTGLDHQYPGPAIQARDFLFDNLKEQLGDGYDDEDIKEYANQYFNMSPEKAKQLEENYKATIPPKGYDAEAEEEKYMRENYAPDYDSEKEGYSGNESQERSKASELYGTDLNKQQGYDYDRLSQELDKGDMINLDAGLLPYEYGFETNGHEDLAVDARKNPETGKYEVFMYPETENGPVEEPDENYPDYEFDSFDDLKAFMENNYKKVETPKYDPMNEPGSGGVTKELVDFVREQLKADGGLNDNFIDAYLSKMPQNSNQADYWKGKMKEAWEKKNGGKK